MRLLLAVVVVVAVCVCLSLSMVMVAQLMEPMPMMQVVIPKPGSELPVYPPGSLSLSEPPEGWKAEELLQGGIEDFNRCGCCSTSDQVCVWGADTKGRTVAGAHAYDAC